MRRFHPVGEMTRAKLLELWREPEAIFWVFVFPVLLTIGLGLAFRSKPPDSVPIGVLEGDRAAWAVTRLAEASGVDARLLDADTAELELRTGAVALVVIPDGAGWTYWFDRTRADSQVAELLVDRALQGAEGGTRAFEAGVREMTEKGSRYIDFLVPGLLGMNLMGTGMWGVGFYIVTSRQRGLLKRLIATPMKKRDFLLAQLAGRMIFLLFEVGVIVGFATWVFDVPMRGSILALTTVSLLGGATFAGLGLLVASRAKTIEGVSGLMNFVMMPMWLLSGIFFSTSRFPDLVQPFAQALPLTALNDALRGVMLEGSTLFQIAGEVGIVAAWCVFAFVGALALFRWT